MKRKKIYLIVLISFVLLLLVGVILYKTTTLFTKDEWTITQYGPREINSSFYTLYNPKRGLIVVDGGWTEDAPAVRDVVKMFGNQVDAWILTHSHQDHIGAFNVIYPDLQGMKIKAVYTVDMATPKECLEMAPWDSVVAYEEFLELERKDFHYLYTGEETEICGLKIEVLNAFGEHVRQYSRDYINDGSLMFRVEAKEQTMLFYADVGESISDYLLNRWSEKLPADYLQMGHHGYGGLKDDFYRTVNPKVAFFDAPSHMMLDETGKYDNSEHRKLMEGMGSEVYSFIGGPIHSVILK